MNKLRAGIIGLGQAGSRFDEEPREAIWTHAGAYLELSDQYELIAGVDPDASNRQRFSARCPGVAVHEDIQGLLDTQLDVVSIATPPSARLDIFEALLSGPTPPKLVICEKPLATDLKTRQRLVSLCEEKNVKLLVHYNRRYTEIYKRLAEAMHDGLIGDIAGITVRAPNRLWSIGSHALDLILFLAREHPQYWEAIGLSGLHERGEPAADFICTFPSGVAGRMLTQGLGDMLIFEVDVTGCRGRLLVTNNGQELIHVPFVKSDKYLGYKVSSDEEILYRTEAKESAFVNIIEEAYHIVEGTEEARCTGEMALVSEQLLEEIVNVVEKKS